MSTAKKSARKRAPKKAAAKADPHTTGAKDQGVGKPAASPAEGDKASRSSEKSVGLKHHPANKNIPASAIIHRTNAETATPVEPSPKVIGNKSLVVFDVMQKRPVEVFLLEAKALGVKADGRLIFVQGEVSNGLMTAAGARSKFAIDPDGTALYNARGFDDAAGAKFDLLDVAALIESQ